MRRKDAEVDQARKRDEREAFAVKRSLTHVVKLQATAKKTHVTVRYGVSAHSEISALLVITVRGQRGTDADHQGMYHHGGPSLYGLCRPLRGQR